MMRVLVAVDSFKGSLTSLVAGNAIADGLVSAGKDIKTLVRPVADGGEGTVEALTLGLGGTLKEIEVTGPLISSRAKAKYGIIPSNHLAIIEMSSASGLTLIPDNLRDPLNTTTYGVGEIILNAISNGCRDFIIGIGGSATNDGGTGMLSALGFEFLDSNNEPIMCCGRGLKNLAVIKNTNANPLLKECTFSIACDVNNPLCGENGCSLIYGPQKGGSIADLKQMDKWLNNYAELTSEFITKADPNYCGAGAAGGMGFAFREYLNGDLKSGARLIFDKTNIEEYIKNSDVVIVGEGKIDSQTIMGKAPYVLSELAKKYNKRVIAIGGIVTEDSDNLNIDRYQSIREGQTIEEAMAPDAAYDNLYRVAGYIAREVL